MKSANLNKNFTISGQFVDLIKEAIYGAELTIENGLIKSITAIDNPPEQYIIPGLIDAHIHIESSMLSPANFAKTVVKHGTVSVVADPHEIANVLGLDGINFMIKSAKTTPLKAYFGAPSCVPATNLETSGATLDSKDIDILLQKKEIVSLAEMMNFPGVIHKDPEVMAKLKLAQKHNLPVDGHAPGLPPDLIKKYIEAGISTDHECFTIEEALEKISHGMHIQIREGSAAKNLDELMSLIDSHPDRVMLCSDDRHPDDLVYGHINQLLKHVIESGINPINAIKACTLNPINHYKLDVGFGQIGQCADLVIIDNFKNFNVEKTIINGEVVFEDNQINFTTQDLEPINKFFANNITVADLHVEDKNCKVNVINVLDGQLITQASQALLPSKNGSLISDTENDVLKLVCLNRYDNSLKSKPQMGFIKNFGLKKGAIASTIAHDSHNIIAVGSSDEEIVHAINLVIKSEGAIVATDGHNDNILPLEIAGIMSNQDANWVAEKYLELNQVVKNYGCTLRAPFMTLSFMALLVIPSIKLSDKGLFDGDKFEFISIYS